MSTGRRPDEVALWWMICEDKITPREAGIRLGMNHKRVWYLCEKWARRGIYDYGVSCDLGSVFTPPKQWRLVQDPDGQWCYESWEIDVRDYVR